MNISISKFNMYIIIYYDSFYVYRIYGENGEVMGLIDHEVGESL